MNLRCLFVCRGSPTLKPGSGACLAVWRERRRNGLSPWPASTILRGAAVLIAFAGQCTFTKAAIAQLCVVLYLRACCGCGVALSAACNAGCALHQFWQVLSPGLPTPNLAQKSRECPHCAPQLLHSAARSLGVLAQAWLPAASIAPPANLYPPFTPLTVPEHLLRHLAKRFLAVPPVQGRDVNRQHRRGYAPMPLSCLGAHGPTNAFYCAALVRVLGACVVVSARSTHSEPQLGEFRALARIRLVLGPLKKREQSDRHRRGFVAQRDCMRGMQLGGFPHTTRFNFRTGIAAPRVLSGG